MDDFTKQLAEGMKNIKYEGVMENPTHIFDWKSSHCGDRAKLFIRVENDIIVEASYEHLGCALNCLVFEEIIGHILNKPFSEILEISRDSFSLSLDVPQRKMHCVDLAFDTINKGLLQDRPNN